MRNYTRFFALLIITLITTTLSGAEWMFGNSFLYSANPMGWHHFFQGLYFSLPLLGILTAHEFGHYLTARYHKIKTSLPLYIPLWLGFLPLYLPTIGTMGAFIRIKQHLKNRITTFDIGVSGPLAGFVVALVVLIYAFNHLPQHSHIFDIHPEYKQYGYEYAKHVYQNQNFVYIKLGTNFLFEILKAVYLEPGDYFPNPYELYHYPFLFAGYLALFFTALNLIPIGQLDGGHILHGLLGHFYSSRVYPIVFIVFMLYAGLGNPQPVIFKSDDYYPALFNNLIHLGILLVAFSRFSPHRVRNVGIALMLFAIQFGLSIYLPHVKGYTGWMLFGLLIGRFLGVYHPPTYKQKGLGTTRKILGWLALVVFILCFSPQPFIIE